MDNQIKVKENNLQIVVDRLNRKYGKVSPQQLVVEAREVNSGIHDLFEWDDSEAANKFRILQAAKYLIMNVKVIATSPEFLNVKVEYIKKPKILSEGHSGSYNIRALNELEDKERVIRNGVKFLRKVISDFHDVPEILSLIKLDDFQILDDKYFTLKPVVIKEDSWVFCQNIACPEHKKIQIVNAKKIDGLYFCSQGCADYYRAVKGIT